MDAAITDVQVALAYNGQAPSEIMIMPLGHMTARDGRVWNLIDPAAVIEASRSTIDLPIDYEHQGDSVEAQQSGPIKAAGWISELFIKPDGLYAKVTWTEAAREMIAKREYRYISPTFMHHRDTDEVLRIKGASLVMTPALEMKALAKLHGRSTDNFKATVCAALGVDATTDDDIVLQTIIDQSVPDPREYISTAAFNEVFNDRKKLRTELHEQGTASLVAQAIEGAHITPAMKDWATAMCRTDPDAFQALLEGEPAYAGLFKSPLDRTQNVTTSSQASYDEEVNRQLGLPLKRSD